MSAREQAAKTYAAEGPGIGGASDIFDWLDSLGAKYACGTSVLDVGFGNGAFLIDAVKRGFVANGVDVARASLDGTRALAAEKNIPQTIQQKRLRLWQIDASYEDFPLTDDSVDLVACTEAIEHMSNPLNMVLNAKRVLKGGGLFVLSFPMPEVNLGYGCGEHAHIYPGFLARNSFETFMRQCFFKFRARRQNGASAWYIYENYKGAGIVSPFSIVAGNYDAAELFAPLEGN